jgi:hypothetical protein
LCAQLGHALPTNAESDLVVMADVAILQSGDTKRCITLLHADDMMLNVPRYSPRCVRGFEAARLKHATIVGFDVNIVVIEEWEALSDNGSKLEELTALLV